MEALWIRGGFPRSFLAEDADLISIRPKEPQNQSLFLSRQVQQNVAWVALVILPLIFVVAGLFGVKVLHEGLCFLAPSGEEGVIRNVVRKIKIKSLLAAWLLLYAVIGGQLAWTLKPYVGTPYLPATPPFRVEAGNIFVSVFRSVASLGR